MLKTNVMLSNTDFKRDLDLKPVLASHCLLPLYHFNHLMGNLALNLKPLKLMEEKLNPNELLFIHTNV